MSHKRTHRKRHAPRTIVAAAATVAAVVAAPVAWGSINESGGSTGADKPRTPTEVTADFDNDGHEDLATGAPGAAVDGEFNAGYIAVSYGSEGAAPDRTQVLSQADEAVPGEATEEAAFGLHSVARDLDGDGYTDLVSTSDGLETESDGVGVLVLWGSSEGLQRGTVLQGASVPGGMGEAYPLVGGDFNGDRKADLVLGAGQREGYFKGPFTREGKPAAVGPVPGTRDTSEGLVAGDVNGDGADDLVNLREGETRKESRAEYIAGGKEGFGKPDRSLLPPADNGTVGDVDDDGYGDLVLRTLKRDEDDPERLVAGPLAVLSGSAEGPDPERTTKIDQDTEGVPGKDRQGSMFGAALDAGDVNGDGYADVAVGVPAQDVDGKKDAGAVILLRGGSEGLTGKQARMVDESTGGEPSDVEKNNQLSGGAMRTDADLPLRLLDVTGDGDQDLAVGTPEDDDGAGIARTLAGDEAYALTPGKLPDGTEVPEKDSGLGYAFAQ
ncbi:VCBS repeat-containing protein [Streptomyces oceani]|uniref:VCBS repeat-containing protein n=1 Tax=Streptomyces oceani TaxID=1075402 RepID=UPI00087329F2|nr:FG-GAP and VCBS repeat-containing protein [Streptomyces oceani]